MADLVPTRLSRTWPVVVRRARSEDRDTVLAFTRDTFDGWDYIHEVWADWVADEVGAFLVATAEPGSDGVPPTDRDGNALLPGQVIAITHLAMLTATEGWVEGIRVDPSLRGMDVATDLLAGVLAAAEAAGATIVRYVTGTRNEGSLRLAARHGLLPVTTSRFLGRGRRPDEPPAADRGVEAMLAAIGSDGTLMDPGRLDLDADPEGWFAWIAADPTFLAGHALYEHRAWAYQALTPELLAGHVAAGEVLAVGPDRAGRRALLIINRARSIKDGELWPALAVGEGGQMIRLLERLGGAEGPLARLRLPDGAPLLEGQEAAFERLGYTAHPGQTVVVEKHLRS